MLLLCAALILSGFAEPEVRGNQRADLVFEFAKTLCWRNDRNKAMQYLEDYAEIPVIREKSRVGQLQVVPSTKEGVKILLAHFKDETLQGERLAFIWEIAVKNDRITQIRVLYDGTNPLVDEARLIREYQQKYKKHVLVPTAFPFDVTRFDGHMESDGTLALIYRSDELRGFFRVIASPVTVELDQYKGKHDVYYQLKDGTQALFRPNFEQGYELRFQKGGMQYTLAIGNKRLLKKKFKAEDLLMVANGMV